MPQRETKRTTTKNGMARSPSNKCKRRVRSLASTWRMTRGSLSAAGSSIGNVRAIESASGADDRENDRIGVLIRGGTGVPPRRTFRLTARAPRIHLRYSRTTPEGVQQQRKLETLWRSLTSGVEEAASRGEGDHNVGEGLEESEEF